MISKEQLIKDWQDWKNPVKNYPWPFARKAGVFLSEQPQMEDAEVSQAFEWLEEEKIREANERWAKR